MRAEFINLRPAGGFGLIMADPAWPYNMYSEKGYGKSPEAHYDTMDLAAIKAMPVEQLAAPDCLLWLWAVNPQLPQALEVVAAWGFAFKTAGTWLKRTVHGKVSFGTGYILRSANEPFILATRGKPRIASRAIRSAVVTHDLENLKEDDWPISSITIEDVVRGHSRKPDAAFRACDDLMPDARKLELFSRQNRHGWSSWGKEVGKFGVAP